MGFQNGHVIKRVIEKDANELYSKINHEPKTDNSIVVIAMDKQGEIILACNESIETLRHILKRATDKATRIITRLNAGERK